MPFDKCPGHSAVAAHGSQHSQFDLGIVGVQQQISLSRHKEFPHISAEFGADRDVLQVRVHRTDPSGAGLGLTELGVYPSGQICRLGQSVHICGPELLERAVLQDMIHDRVRVCQLLQCLGVRGVTGLCLLPGGKSHLSEQYVTQLFRAVDVEFVSCFPVYLLLLLLRHGSDVVAELRYAVAVH